MLAAVGAGRSWEPSQQQQKVATMQGRSSSALWEPLKRALQMRPSCSSVCQMASRREGAFVKFHMGTLATLVYRSPGFRDLRSDSSQFVLLHFMARRFDMMMSSPSLTSIAQQMIGMFIMTF